MVKLKKVKKVIFFVFVKLLLISDLYAQNETDERALVRIQDGISLQRDTLFLLNLRLRIQNRFGIILNDQTNTPEFDARVRRLRLRLDGYVLSPRVQYYVQLSFSQADQELDRSNTPQIIRDAILYYVFSDKFYMGFGQSKLPGNRQRVISSGSLQFVDRSLANATFNLDRDFGFFFYYNEHFSTQKINVKAAITTGEGRNAQITSAGLCYTGRIEWLPFGKFLNAGDFTEGDLEIEKYFKLSLAAGYSFNKNASRTGGQIGGQLFEHRNFSTFIADGIAKYYGWALQAEYFRRHTINPITQNTDGQIAFVYNGSGYAAQLSKFFSPGWEVALRLATTVPDEDIKAVATRFDEYLTGVSRYLRGHRIKAQLNVGYTDRFQPSGRQRDALLTFQVEFGF
ncbi:MAG: porin [Thermaurantimonas sp.]|uniref:porin n=1 Tax=Thermaurantimonas sp. TaxID=2681568 RepID=UPI00391A3ED8